MGHRAGGDQSSIADNGGTPNGGYTWLVTTNLAASINWTTNRTSLLDGTGAFSNTIPINASQPASFYRMRVPKVPCALRWLRRNELKSMMHKITLPLKGLFFQSQPAFQALFLAKSNNLVNFQYV
jgi:hypothetical protein